MVYRMATTSHVRSATHGRHTVARALDRLGREHVALLLALCEMESAPAYTAGDPTNNPQVREALRMLLREDLARTQHALALAAHGHYGWCEDCHRPLSPRSLELRPSTTRCARCATHSHHRASA